MYQENNQKSWSTILKIGTVEFTELQSTRYWKDIRTNGSRKTTLEIPGNEEARKEIRKQERLQGTPAGTAWLACGHSCRRCHHLCSCYCEDSDPQNSLIPRFTHCSESQEGTHIRLTELCLYPQLLEEACRKVWIPWWTQTLASGLWPK